jgi:hypothetical protein
METVMKDVKVKPPRGKGRTKAAAPVAAAVAKPVAKAARTAARKVKAPTMSEAAPALFDTQPIPAAVKAPSPPPPPTLIETVVAPIAALGLTAEAPAAETILRPVKAALGTGTESARTFYAKAQETGDTMRNAVSESAAAASRGLVELNGQLLDLMRAQSDATFSVWRSALAAGSVSEAIRLQTSGVRQVYETSAGHWKAMAETAGRTAEAAMRPLQSVLARG